MWERQTQTPFVSVLLIYCQWEGLETRLSSWPIITNDDTNIDKIAGNSADNSADNIDDNSTVLPFITFKKAGDLIPNSEICLNPERASI